MSDFTFSEFCERLTRSRLMSSFAVQEAISQARVEGAGEMSSREFADWLATRGKLSRFQADSLLQGYTRFFLDDFKLVDRIGVGRMAGVFRAVHKLGMPIAVKILPPKRAQKPDLLARFQREAQLARLLNHPHVVKTYHSGSVDGVHYIAMEYLEGETLEERLRERKVLPPSEVFGLAEQVLQALQHVYKKRLVHRDVKPANLMLVPLPGMKDARTRPYTVKLLDVGLGRALFSGDDENPDLGPDLTKKGDVIGTLAYMAPEQHADSHAADIRSDLYSLGCVLYECLTGRPPFEDRNAVQVIVKHATQMPADLALEDYPRTQALQQWLWKLLAKKKSERFRTPNDAIRALHALIQVRSPAPPQIVAPRIPRKRKAWEQASEKPEPDVALAWIYFGTGVALLCALLIGLFSLLGSPAREAAPAMPVSESSVVDVRSPAQEFARSESTDSHAANSIPAVSARSDSQTPKTSESKPLPVRKRHIPVELPARADDSDALPTVEIEFKPARQRAAAPRSSGAAATSPALAAAGKQSIAPDTDPLEPAEPGPRPRWTAVDSEFTLASSSASPGVAYRLERQGSDLHLIVEVESTSTERVDLQVGLSAKRQKVLSPVDAVTSRLSDAARFEFRCPTSELVDKETDWSKLRMGLAAVWKDASSGVERQRERMRHVDRRAPHAAMSAKGEDWAPLDLAANEQHLADVRQKIVISVRQPVAGKATIVIEDKQGQRIRNLVSAQPLPEGDHRFEWDGLDEKRAPVKPGEYRWRSIHHTGIKPSYQFSFGNGGSPTHESWGPNHTMFVAVAANRDSVFLGAPSTEGGHALVALDKQGLQVKSFHAVDGHNHFTVALAADDRHLYVLHLDPTDWGAHGAYATAKAPNRKGKERITLSRFEVASGNHVPWEGQAFVSVGEFGYGPDSATPVRTHGQELGGAVVRNGNLFVSLKFSNAVRVIDTATGRQTAEFSVPEPGPICAGDECLFVGLRDQILRLDPTTGTTSAYVATAGLRLGGMVCDDDGDVYVTDANTQQIHVFRRDGAPARVIGKPGGNYTGTYDPQRLVDPFSLAIGPDGKLWVTEVRMTPKRVLACDRHSGQVLVEKIGPAGYGGGGGGIDAGDPTRWIIQNVLWKLDFAAKKAAPQSILLNQGHLNGRLGGAMHYRFVRHQGRTFVIGMSLTMFISELMPDGHLRDLAFFGHSHSLWVTFGRKLPEEYLEACRGVVPAEKDPARSGWGVLWVDRNGDGALQAAEFDIAPETESFAGGSWGQDQFDLTLRLTCFRKGRPALLTLPLLGFHASGAPQYPKLSTAVEQAKVCDLKNEHGADSTVDRFGNMLVLDNPLQCFAPDGRTLWTYPNQWNGVHGSHTAPLPERGVLQGALFFLGTAPLDDRSDVFVVNGNHGRFFVMTGDGLYLDEMFSDVRMQAAGNEYLIGGECFGGCFARGETDGNYYLQARGGRVYRILGFDTVQRQEGTLTVSNAQRAAAQRSSVRNADEKVKPRHAVIEVAPAVEQLPNWFNSSDSPTANWHSGQVHLAHDGQQLFASWFVWDKSPWVNQGKDWQTLFKTGDSVDLQLGTDPKADPQRSDPVPGDIRLLIAPFQGQNIAVAYRHRVTKGPKKPAKFSSPWRTETVDDVRILKSAQIRVVIPNPGGYRVFATVPLADLGLTRVPSQPLRADFGVIYSNPEGTANVLRSYWSNPMTGLVNDVPGEIMLTPRLWGQVQFEPHK